MDKMHWYELLDGTKIRMRNGKGYTPKDQEAYKKDIEARNG